MESAKEMQYTDTRMQPVSVDEQSQLPVIFPISLTIFLSYKDFLSFAIPIMVDVRAVPI